MNRGQNTIITIIVIVVIIVLAALIYVNYRNPSLVPSETATSTATSTSENASSTASNTSAANQVMVSIANYQFSPAVITVKKGTVVTWVNNDSVTHQIAADSQPPQNRLNDLLSEQLKKGDKYTYTFSQAGTWNYHCQIHPTMKGRVIVTP